jgi:Protein of unknown function (DUF4038)
MEIGIRYKFLLLLFFSSVFLTNSVAQTKNIPKLIVFSNGHFLMTEAGKPFFWLGDTGWLLFSKLNRTEADQYLEDRRRKGFNVIQAMLLHSVDDVDVYGDSALLHKNVAAPKTTPGKSFNNKAQYDFWDHVDHIIDRAAEKGLYMALVPIWGGNVKEGLVNLQQAKTY